ncbi:MAG: carboxypeptidase regulatory-like domain-containing protein, partial [Thermoplasmata archaeon]
PQQPPPQHPQTTFGYGYNYYWQYFQYPYTFQYYPPPKYYYEIIGYAQPFAPPGKKQSLARIKVIWILLALIAATNLISGGFLLFAAYDENQEHAVILSGSVVDGHTLQPLKDVKITVLGRGLTVFTNADGSFQISLQTGSYSIVFEKVGYQIINGTVFAGKYLDNTILVEMEEGTGTQTRNFTSFQTFEDYIANLLVSGTLAVFVGAFAIGSVFQIRKVRYRSMGIVSGVLGIFSLFIFSGLSWIFMVPAIISTILGCAVLVLIYFSSELFISQAVATTGTD